MKRTLLPSALLLLAAAAHCQTLNLTAVTLDQAAYVGGDEIVGVVFLSGVVQGSPTTVTLTDNTSAVVTPASVSVPVGKTAAKFTCTSSAVSAAATRLITASRNGVTKTAAFDLRPRPTLVGIDLKTPSVIGGLEGLFGYILLSGIAPKPNAMVKLSDDTSAISLIGAGPDYFFLPGQDKVSFIVSTSAVTSTVQRHLFAKYEGVTKSATVTLKPNPLTVKVELSWSIVQGEGFTYISLLPSNFPPGIIASASYQIDHPNISPPSSSTYMSSTGWTFTIYTTDPTVAEIVPITIFVGGTTYTRYILILPAS